MFGRVNFRGKFDREKRNGENGGKYQFGVEGSARDNVLEEVTPNPSTTQQNHWYIFHSFCDLNPISGFLGFI